MNDPATLFSSRTGLEPGAETFVGRTATLTDLFRRLAGPNGCAAVAVQGPRRIGKSSLLKQLISPAARARFVPEAESWRCVYIDSSSRPWRGFDDFRAHILRKIGRAADLASESFDPNESLEDTVIEITRRVDVPIVLVLDEFDCIASELRKVDQAELRGAVSNVPPFGLVLGVARSPEETLQYVGDDVSDLAGILSIAQPTLGGFNEEEARTLIRVGRTHCAREADGDAENEILQRAGLHPLLLQAACYGWYSVVGIRDTSELPSGERIKAIEAIDRELAHSLAFVRRSFTPGLRAIIDCGAAEEALNSARVRREVETMGVTTILHRFAPSASPAESEVNDDPMTTLEGGILRLNYKQRLATSQPAELVRDCRKTNDPVFLRRTPRNDQEFSDFIGAISRLLYDGTNGVTSPQARGKVKPTLPKFCYRDTRSVVVHILSLRNHYIHPLTPDDAIAIEHLKSAGDVFQIYCGKRVPDDPDFDGLRRGILEASTEFINRLALNVPVSEDMKPDIMFS